MKKNYKNFMLKNGLKPFLSYYYYKLFINPMKI